MQEAFFQIPLSTTSKEKTAFPVPGRGLFHFCVVPFGLRNSAQIQQRLMDSVFGPKLEPNIFCYLGDIIIISSTLTEHVRILSEVREVLKIAGLTVNLNKCEFSKSSLKCLEYVVNENSLAIDPEQVAAMVNFPRTKDNTEIKRFLVLTLCYRRFIPPFLK